MRYLYSSIPRIILTIKAVLRIDLSKKIVFLYASHISRIGKIRGIFCPKFFDLCASIYGSHFLSEWKRLLLKWWQIVYEWCGIRTHRGMCDNLLEFGRKLYLQATTIGASILFGLLASHISVIKHFFFQKSEEGGHC